MWDQLSAPWRACMEQAWEAYCAGTVPIGSVITNAAGCILSTGRNRIYQPREASLDYLSGTALAHAEINAIYACDFHGLNPRECILYTTTEPCPMCAGAIVMAHIRSVRYASRDPWAGATNLYTASAYLSRKKMSVSGPSDPRFEAALYAIQADFHLRKAISRGVQDPFQRPRPVLDEMEAANPAGIQLGEQLYHNGGLQRMVAEHYTVREVLDTLEGLLVGVEV